MYRVAFGATAHVRTPKIRGESKRCRLCSCCPHLQTKGLERRGPSALFGSSAAPAGTWNASAFDASLLPSQPPAPLNFDGRPRASSHPELDHVRGTKGLMSCIIVVVASADVAAANCQEAAAAACRKGQRTRVVCLPASGCKLALSSVGAPAVGTRPGRVRKCTGDRRFLPTAVAVLLGWPHKSFARGLVKFTVFVLTGSPCDVCRQSNLRGARNRCRESRTKGESERAAPVQSEDLRYAPWRWCTTCAICLGCVVVELPYRSQAATSPQPFAEVHGPSPHSSRCLPELLHVT